MSIQSTVEITRETAIGRIRRVLTLLNSKDYRGLELESCEPDTDVQHFVDTWESSYTGFVDKYTDKMLEEIMDAPFFRASIFANYSIQS